MAEKKSWRDYSKDNTTEKETSEEKTGTWRDYSSDNSTGSSERSGGWRDHSKYDVSSAVGNNVINKVNKWLNNHSAYVSDYQKRNSGRKYSYEDSYVSDSGDWLEKAKKQKSDYDTEADEILSYIDKYKGYLDDDWVAEIKSTISGARSNQNKIIEAYTKDNEWWNSFGSEDLIKEYGSAEDAYKYYQMDDRNRKTYSGMSSTEISDILEKLEDGAEKDWLTNYKSAVVYDERSKADLDAMAKEIEDMENLYDDAFTVDLWHSAYELGHTPYDANRMKTYNRLKKEYGGDIYSLEEAIAKKKQEMTLAGRVQEGIKLSGVGDETSEYYDPEFKQYTGYTGSTWIDGGFDRFFSWDDSAGMKTGYEDIRYDYINDPDAVTKVLSKSANDADLHLLSGLQPYQHMTEDQVATYNYYYAKHGKEAADNYLDSIQDSLNATQGQQMAQRIDNKWLLQQLSGIGAGLDQAHSGLKNVFSNADYIPTSATQYASGYVRENLGENGGAFSQGVYDLITTTANMAPSILVSTALGALNPVAGAAAGNALMGASAAGNAYSDAINRGFGKKEARTYSTLIGASEVALGSMLGGISKLGGVSSKLAKAVAGIDNGLARWALQYGGKIASESLEEGLQEILDPLLQNAILHADEDVDWGEVAYSALLGGLSAGLLEGVGTVAQVATEQKLKKAYDGNTDSLINEGLESDLNTESYQIAKQYKAKTDSGKTLTGAEIRNLLAANQEQVTPKDMKLIQKAAENRLTELGQTENVSKLAELATKYAVGQKLSKEEKSFLANSQYGSQVSKELLPENIGADGFDTAWAENIGTRKVNFEAYNKDKIKARKAFEEIVKKAVNGDPAAYKSLAERVGNEAGLSASENSKATIRESGKEIDLKQAEVVNFVQDKTGKITDMTLLVDGEQVKASGIDYSDGSRSYLFEAVQKIENITPGAATAAVRGYDPSSGQTVSEYLNGFDEGYTYGYHGYSEADLKAGNFTTKLSEAQMMDAYRLGQSAKNISKTKKAETIKKMRTAAQAETEKIKADGKEATNGKKMTITYNAGSGKVVDFDQAGVKGLTAKQKAAPAFARIMHEMGLGTNFELYSSYLSKTMKDKKTGKPLRVRINENGVEEAAPAGVYRKSDGTVCIDLNAYNGKKLTLDAMAHELTHFIQQWSDEKYSALADFLVKTYAKTDMSMNERVLREQARLKEVRNEDVSYNEAYDEVVANAMSKMLADGKVMERLNELKAQDMDLAQKLWEGLKKLLNKFFRIYEQESALFYDAADLMELKEDFEQMQKMWADAFVEASDNFQSSLTPGAEGTAYTNDGEVVAHSTEDGSVQLSLQTYDEVGRDTFRDYLEKSVSSNRLTKSEMKEMLSGIEEIYKVCKEFKDKYAPFGTWSEASVVRDTYGKPVFSVVTPNGEYKMNLDFSLVCKKRRTLDAVFNEMSRRGIIDNFELGQKSVVKINEIIRKYGFETACALCFVDAKRFRQASMADSFTRLYNELVTSLVPESQRNSIDHFNFSSNASIKKVEGGIDTWDASKLDFSHINEVMKNYGTGTVEYKAAKYIKTHAEGRKLLLRGDFMSSQGFDAVKTQNKDILSLYNSKKGTGGPKAAFGDVQYLNEIIQKARFWTPAKAYAVGGVRIQSFSDYVPRMVFDYVQMIYDLAATKLPAHAYTKEALFAKQFGMTGIKINMSLIPAIADGGVAAGLDANGNYVWAGESFDFETAKQIQSAEGYTENCGTICVGVSDLHIRKLLNDPDIRMVIPYHKSGLNPIVAHMNRIAQFTDYTGSQNTLDRNGSKISKDFDFSKALHDMGENGDPKAVIKQYLDWCDKNGYTPKFSQFRDHPNYYKLIEDFTLYDMDNQYVPQREVRAVFPTEGSAFGSMKSLIEAGLQEDAVIEGKRDSKLSSIVDEIEQTLPKTEAEIPETEVEQADHDIEAGEMYSPQQTDADYSKPITEADVKLLRSIGRKSVNDFTPEDIQKAQKWAYMYKDLKGKSPFFRAWFGDWRKNEGKKIAIATIPTYIDSNEERKKNRGAIKNEDTSWTISISREGETNTISHAGIARLSEYGLSGIKELVSNAYLLDTEVHEHHSNNAKNDLIAFDHKLYALGQSENGDVALYRITVEDYFQSKKQPSNKRFHNLKHIEKIADITGGRTFGKNRSGGSANGKSAITYTVADLVNFVNMYDSEYTSPKEPSAVVEDGKPLIVYHGTNAKFNTFRSQSGEYWFSKNEDYAEAMMEERGGGEVKAVYLYMHNPYRAKLAPGQFSDPNYEAQILRNAKAAGHDGVIIENNTTNPIEAETFYVVFKPEQIKSATDNIGTFDISNPDIRYSTQETDNISNRDLLANAFEGIVQNSNEYKLIQEYKGRIKILNEYEDKLYELNEEIRRLTFETDGKRDTERLQQLHEEADKIAKNINRVDKRLLSLEASEPLRKVIDRERKKEAQKTKEHVKEIQQNKKLRAEQTELRHKIRKTIRDLDKILNRGNKKQNVKQDMKGFVSKALKLADYIFTDHLSNDDLIRSGIDSELIRGENEERLVRETEDILAKLYDQTDTLTDEEFTMLDAKRKANEDKLKDLLTAQRNKTLSTPVYKLFDDLVTEYASLKNSSQDAVKAAYNVDLENTLRSLMGDEDQVGILKNMRVADMTTKELENLLKAYKMVLVNVRDADKIHAKVSALTIGEMADKISNDFGSRKIPDKKLAIAIQKIANKIGWDYEKLYYALDRIGSEAFTELFINLADSENIIMQDIIEAELFRDEMVKNYGYNNWVINKELDNEFIDNTGKKFKLTLGQVMALYAYSRRDGAWKHLEFGGFAFGKAALTNPRPADTYKLNQAQCEAITSLLTAEQKAYAEHMQKYLSKVMGAKGNEVSMKLYGIEMFGEENYFPIHVAGQYMARAEESNAKASQGFQSMSNAGFTHAQNRNAMAPIVLEGFNEIWVDHVNEMSRYHGAVPALEDIRRVMNRSTYSDSTTDSTAIKAQMINAFGEEAAKYFDNLYKEANSGAITDKMQATSKKLMSLFRKNSVAYSLSVLAQQPVSLTRAYAMIDKKYFGFHGFGAITSGIAKAVSSKWNSAYADAYNEMLKYAPGVTKAKEIGGFDTATGGSIRSHLLDTNKSIKQKWKTGTKLEKAKAALDLVDDNAIANLPNVADKIAWIEIWNACKRETVATHKDLATNSDAFMQTVGERFTEVIRATQVYDSIFAKSPMLKSKNLAVQYLVSFANEPNTIANMAEKAVRDATRGNWKQGAKTAAVLAYSTIFTAAIKSVIYALRDDDEDETYIEKYIESVTGNMMSDFNPISYIPLGRDVLSLWQGYDVERPDMAIISDAIDAVRKKINLNNADVENMTEEQLIELEKKVTEANWKLVETVAGFFGIPVKNIRRDVKAIFVNKSAPVGQETALSIKDTVSDAINGSSGKTKQEKLYYAILNGDDVYAGRIKSTYKTEDSYHSAVRTALRENDPRIKEAALAQINGDPSERVRIAKLIIADGFEQDDVVTAINSEISAMTPDDDTGAKKEKGFYTVADFVKEMANGDNTAASAVRDDVIQTAQKNGKTQEEAENSFVSSVKTQAKKEYLDGSLNDSQAEKILLAIGEDEEDVAPLVSYWSFIKAHPQYDLAQDKVEKYKEFAEPAEIPLDIFVQYVEGTKGLKTIKDEWGDEIESVRDQVLAVIDSLDLTWQQKDALYLAHELAESRIWDVPW